MDGRVDAAEEEGRVCMTGPGSRNHYRSPSPLHYRSHSASSTHSSMQDTERKMCRFGVDHKDLLSTRPDYPHQAQSWLSVGGSDWLIVCEAQATKDRRGGVFATCSSLHSQSRTSAGNLSSSYNSPSRYSSGLHGNLRSCNEVHTLCAPYCTDCK